ncbi:MAG: plastocyanin/azurin family copper-binding protein [Actinomycetota bacterium]
MKPLACCVLLALISTSCGSGLRARGCDEKAARAAVAIQMRDSKFDPRCVKAAVGAEISFVDRDRIGHSVTTTKNAPESLDATLSGSGSTFPHVFKKRGVYEIFCKFHHETMVLLIS